MWPQGRINTVVSSSKKYDPIMKMLTGEVGIDLMLVIPETRAAKCYRELRPHLGQRQSWAELGEDRESSITESLHTIMGSDRDSDSPSDQKGDKDKDQRPAALEVTPADSSRFNTPPMPAATPAVQRLASQFEKLREIGPEGSRQRAGGLEYLEGFQKIIKGLNQE